MRRGLLFPLALLLASAVLLSLPGTAEAQRRFIGRGFRPGFRPFPPNRMPGWDWRRIYPWSPYNYGRNPYNPIIYPYINPYPVYNPSYYASNYPAPYYGGYGGYGGIGNEITSNYTPQQQQPAAGDSVPLPEVAGPVTTPPAGGAIIRLSIPDPMGQVYFDGVQTSSIGTQRWYVTPQLPDGRNLTYTVRATFNRNGQPVSEERRIVVAPGRTSVVDFTR
jgi:uncharacterized protein (TIGR03000 family)